MVVEDTADTGSEVASHDDHNRRQSSSDMPFARCCMHAYDADDFDAFALHIIVLTTDIPHMHIQSQQQPVTARPSKA